MTPKKNISATLLEKLQTTYERFPAQEHAEVDESQFASGLRDLLDAYGEDVILPAGKTLFYENDEADGLYWVESGVMAILQGDLEKPHLLTFRVAGHVVGEIALLEGVKRTASVVAVTKTHLRFLSQEKFKGLLAMLPGFGLDLMRLLSARLRQVKQAEYGAGMYDHLTGAMSRQAFDMRLTEEIERAQTYQYTFSLVFLDLDHFKAVNDTYGHARGDEVLKEFARRVMDDLRTTDTLFRYGGDEFVLLLQGIDEKRGPGFVQRLLDSSLNSPIGANPPITISFSAGIAYFPEDGTLLEELLKAADERVYVAKAQGRGRVAANAR